MDRPQGKQVIFIDAVTGTWGDYTDLYRVELTEDEIEELDGMADSDITALAVEKGENVSLRDAIYVHFDVEDGCVEVKIVDEGVIVDLIRDGDVVATWGATAEELASDFCH